MKDSLDIFKEQEGVFKSQSLKKNIITYFAFNGDATIADLSKELVYSVPTVTKLVGELIEEGFVLDFGKIETAGGRRPNIYGLNPHSGFFIGVEVKRNIVNIGLMDFKRDLLNIVEQIPFQLINSRESLDELCEIINNFIDGGEIKRDKILGACLNISGRVNSFLGHSYNFFYLEEKPLSEIIESKIGISTFLENDTRAMAYGEYKLGIAEGEKNVLFVNVSRGVGMGIIIDGKLYYGKSGYSGEFGHSPAFDNEILCHCGKKGCLETEISGIALERIFKEHLENGSTSILSDREDKESICVEDIIDAAEKEDVLAIELIADLGEKLGRNIAMLINIFNTELVIIGGTLASTGNYLILPIKSAVNKYSLNLVNNDTSIKLTDLKERAGVWGACLIARDRLLGLL